MLAAFLCAAVLGQPATDKQTVNLTDGLQRFDVLLSASAFVPDDHSLTYTSEMLGDKIATKLELIDGRKPWGVGATLPTRRIEDLAVSIGEQRIPLPASWFSDCFEPGMSTDGPQRSLWAWLSEDKNRLVVKMNGGVEPHAYSVIWTLYKQQPPKREFFVGGKPAPDPTPPPLEPAS